MHSTVDKGASRTATLATGIAFLMITQQVASKALRDVLFLSNFPATKLPIVMVMAAVISFATALGLSRLMARFSPARLSPVIFALSAFIYGLEWWLCQYSPRIAAISVYLHVAALGAFVISSFWSVINERFDSYQAKQVVAPIAWGATMGGVMGGLAAWQLSYWISLPTLLAALGGVNFICAIGLSRIGAGFVAKASPAQSVASSGIQAIRQVPYLQHLAWLIVLTALCETAVDYVFKARASHALLEEQQLMHFFSLFHMATGLAGFVFQSLLARRSLRQLGLAGTIAMLPTAYLFGGALALVAPKLWSMAFLRGAGSAVENSLFRSSYEILYTPLTPEKKRSTKSLIDVGCDRIGVVFGSGLTLAIVTIFPSFADPILVTTAIAAAILALVATNFLNRGYVHALADSLRDGAVKLERNSVIDATTHRTLTDTHSYLDRKKLLTQINELRHSVMIHQSQPGIAASPLKPLELSSHEEDALLVATILALRSRDPIRVRSALQEQHKLTPALVTHLIPLLAEQELLPDIVRVLRKVVHKIAGQLIDAMLDVDLDEKIRRRIPAILDGCEQKRAVDGLCEGLGVAIFELRYRCAVALYKTTQTHPHIQIDREIVFAAAQREADTIQRLSQLSPSKLTTSTSNETPFSLHSANREVARSFEFVFTVLSLVLEREPLQLAYRALATSNHAMMGTSLEYLENVLPLPIRAALWPYLLGKTAS